jgi:hypothetical protein
MPAVRVSGLDASDAVSVIQPRTALDPSLYVIAAGSRKANPLGKSHLAAPAHTGNVT